MAPDNQRLLITDHEIGQVPIRWHSLLGELPGTCRCYIREINSIPDEVQDHRR
jgi:hypothetical protein